MKTNKIITSIVLILTSLSALYAQPVDEFLKVVAENDMGVSERELYDHFGVSVSISGDYAIVGSYNDKDENGGTSIKDAGAAYIFKRQSNGSTWYFEQKIVASDRDEDDSFSSVAISGEYAIVGATGEDPLDLSGNNYLKDAGAAYIFERDGSGNWNEVKKIVAPNRAAGDYFGGGVSISGDYIIVGAGWVGPREPNYGFGAGAAYIFERIGGIWTYTQTLNAFDRQAGDLFGTVSISGNYAIVGAHREDEGSSNVSLRNTGSAYIFERVSSLQHGNKWKFTQKVEAPDRSADDHFGYSVAISGDYAIVGAYAEDHDENGGNGMLFSGSAYIFERDPTAPSGDFNKWNVNAKKIVASDRSEEAFFGHRVAIDGDYVIVGAYRHDAGSLTNVHYNSGAAYIFERENTAPFKWNQIKKIVNSDTDYADNFGNSVAISGCTALIGAWTEDEDAALGNSVGRAGSAYFFECERKEPVLCCDIPGLDIAFTPYRNSDMFSLNINSASLGIQEIEVSMVDYHVEYESANCRPNDMGIFGNIRSTTTNFGGLLLTDNNTHSLTWEAGTPSALNGNIGILISKPNVNIRNCRNSMFYFCLKIKITDTDCNICEQIVCGSLRLGPSPYPGGGVIKK